MGLAIGIDLGTTNTVIAAVADGVAVTLADEHGRRLLPSVVSFHPSGKVLVGELGRERRMVDAESTVYSVKRLIGRPFSSPEVQEAAKRFAFPLVEGPKQSVMVQARGQRYSLPEISAFILRRAKAMAEAALGETVDKAVITVPANFNELQRASTKVAGRLAGLEVLRILNEPTAAALAYGQQVQGSERVAIYDLGGGTFDVTILDLSGQIFEVLSTAGDSQLGGDDVDLALADRISLEYLQKHRYDPRPDPSMFGRLRLVAEQIKKDLSAKEFVEESLHDIGYGPDGGPLSLKFRYTRAELDSLVQPLIDRTLGVTQRALDAIGKTPADIGQVLLVGGSTRLPLVTKQVGAYFGRQPTLKVNPDEVVALGAAIQAHALARTKGPSRTVVNKSTATAGSYETAPVVSVAAGPRLPRNDEAPATPRFSPSEHPKSSNPYGVSTPQSPPSPPPLPSSKPKPASYDYGALPEQPPSQGQPGGFRIDFPEAPPSQGHAPVADFGAPAQPRSFSATSPVRMEFSEATLIQRSPVFAPQAMADGRMLLNTPETSTITPKSGNALLIDVTPLSLRVETAGGYSDVLIRANTPVPCDRSRVFLTARDNQTSVVVRVAQGELPKFAENADLGELVLANLPQGVRGEVRVEVTFELDADGILNVRAMELGSGLVAAATIRLLGVAQDASELAEMQARQNAAAVFG